MINFEKNKYICLCKRIWFLNFILYKYEISLKGIESIYRFGKCDYYIRRTLYKYEMISKTIDLEDIRFGNDWFYINENLYNYDDLEEIDLRLM